MCLLSLSQPYMWPTFLIHSGSSGGLYALSIIKLIRPVVCCRMFILILHVTVIVYNRNIASRLLLNHQSQFSPPCRNDKFGVSCVDVL